MPEVLFVGETSYIRVIKISSKRLSLRSTHIWYSWNNFICRSIKNIGLFSSYLMYHPFSLKKIYHEVPYTYYYFFFKLGNHFVTFRTNRIKCSFLVITFLQHTYQKTKEDCDQFDCTKELVATALCYRSSIFSAK